MRGTPEGWEDHAQCIYCGRTICIEDLPEGAWRTQLGDYCCGCRPEPSGDDEYSDSQRLDELSCVDDYNRFEEQCVFEDREWEDY